MNVRALNYSHLFSARDHLNGVYLFIFIDHIRTGIINIELVLAALTLIIIEYYRQYLPLYFSLQYDVLVKI